MTFKNALLRGVALGAALALAGGAAAQAKPAHHHPKKHAAYGEARPAPTYGEVHESHEDAALNARVQQLEALVQSQAQSMAALQAQVAQNQQQVAQVVADSESVQAQLDSVPAQILATVGELPKPKPSWADKTQITGRMYFNLSGIRQKNNGVSVAPSGTAFDFKRFYVGIDHQFNDVYSANLTMDAEYRAALGANNAANSASGTALTSNPGGGNTEFFIKKAYLQAKYFPWLTLRAGSADLPWIPFVEDLYGYRYVEQTIIDRTKFGTSADWGIHALGTFDPLGDPKTGPVVSYAVAVVNGAGYRRATGLNNAPRSATLDIEGRVSAKWYDWTLGIGGYTGRLGNNAGTVLNAAFAPVTFRDASRFNAVLAYVSGPYRAGVEYFTATNWTAVTNKATGDKADGYSLWGSWAFDPQWAVFGKYENVKSNKTTIPGKEDNYFNIGLQYEPVKIVDLSLVYKRDKVDSCPVGVGCTLSTNNGTIGGGAVAGLGANGTYDEFGLFGQFRW